MANAVFHLSPDDVRSVVARHVADLASRLGDPDLDVRFMDEDGNEVDPPGVRVEAMDTRGVTVLVFGEPIPETDEEGDPVGSAAAGNNGAV